MDDQGCNDEKGRGSLSEAYISRFVDIHIHANVWGVCMLKGL